MEINWKELPFNHSGRWEKKFDSIMAPGTKVTWPQFIAEMVIFWRSRVITDYPKIQMGTGWSAAIQKQVRDLNQQAAVICNYFPHPDDEPLVIYAVRKFFRNNRPLRIGAFRKNRVSVNKKTGRETLNITQAEKDVVLGINAELMKALKARESYVEVDAKLTLKSGETSFKTQPKLSSTKRGTLAFALAMEKQLKSQVTTDE